MLTIILIFLGIAALTTILYLGTKRLKKKAESTKLKVEQSDKVQNITESKLKKDQIIEEKIDETFMSIDKINSIKEKFRATQDAKISLERMSEIQSKDDEDKDTDNLIIDIPANSEIILNNVTFQYEGPHSPKVLNNINLVIPNKKITAIVGYSGSGKSTLLRWIDRRWDVSSGEILFNGENIKNISFYHQKVGMVFQQFNLFPNMTVLENIILAPVKQKIMDRNVAVEKALNLLSSVGLLDKKDSYPKRLSGGEKQRVAIVRTLIMNPDIILFDEPTSSLDPKMTLEILNLIKKLIDLNITILIVSHELGFVKEVAKRVWFLSDGYIVSDTTSKEAFESPKNKELKDFVANVN